MSSRGGRAALAAAAKRASALDAAAERSPHTVKDACSLCPLDRCHVRQIICAFNSRSGLRCCAGPQAEQQQQAETPSPDRPRCCRCPCSSSPPRSAAPRYHLSGWRWHHPIRCERQPPWERVRRGTAARRGAARSVVALQRALCAAAPDASTLGVAVQVLQDAGYGSNVWQDPGMITSVCITPAGEEHTGTRHSPIGRRTASQKTPPPSVPTNRPWYADNTTSYRRRYV